MTDVEVGLLLKRTLLLGALVPREDTAFKRRQEASAEESVPGGKESDDTETVVGDG